MQSSQDLGARNVGVRAPCVIEGEAFTQTWHQECSLTHVIGC